MVEIELPDLENARKSLAAFPGAADWAIARTLNDVTASGKAAATQFIFQRYQFETTGPISRGIHASKVTTGRETAVIRFQGSRFPVKMFLPSRTQVGIEIMELRGERSTIAHAFAAAMQYGWGVFTRKPGAGRGPVQSVVGLSIANMARESTEILPEISNHVREQLAKRLHWWVSEALAGNQEKYQRRHER